MQRLIKNLWLGQNKASQKWWIKGTKEPWHGRSPFYNDGSRSFELRHPASLHFFPKTFYDWYWLTLTTVSNSRKNYKLLQKDCMCRFLCYTRLSHVTRLLLMLWFLKILMVKSIYSSISYTCFIHTWITGCTGADSQFTIVWADVTLNVIVGILYTSL